MDEKKVSSVERVRLALEAKGANSEIERFDQGTRTDLVAQSIVDPLSQQAAGCAGVTSR